MDTGGNRMYFSDISKDENDFDIAGSQHNVKGNKNPFIDQIIQINIFDFGMSIYF